MKFQQRISVLLTLLLGGVCIASAANMLPSSNDMDVVTQDSSYLFAVDSRYSLENPHAGDLFCMDFKVDGTFYYYNLTNSERMQGSYRYQALANKTLSVFDVHNNDGSHYQMILVPKNSTTGSYIYKQPLNKPRQKADTYALTGQESYRLNYSRYVLISHQANFCRQMLINH
ncbi:MULTISPECIES: hypothetical protein [Cysteiniphilum]|uniref:hypothetical protein n=1 Tax=Cysteiniphilum TaxID=2056696 RepID=UPI0017876000|nr:MULTISPECIES: hypothetical protein [Cysteiniphilum]